MSKRLLRRPTVWVTLLAVVVVCAAAVTIGRTPPGATPMAMPHSPPPASATARASLPAVSIRVYKADLIERLGKAPSIVVLGGSRATRFNPAFIRAVTGKPAFNAAVTHASPEDEWAMVTLLHRRFPRAHFRFLWIMHVDEFAGALSRDLLSDPRLAATFPRAWAAAWRARLHVTTRRTPPLARPRNMVITASGYTVQDSIDANASKKPLIARIDATIHSTLNEYSWEPPRLQPQARHYFQKTLALMNRRGDRVVLVLAPLQPRFYAAMYGRGWELRHRLVTAYMRWLRRRYRFGFLDLSRAARIGAPADGFYDGVHLRPSMSRRVFRTVLSAFPRAF